MKISKITTRKYPDQIITRVILDSDKLGDRVKDIFRRIQEGNDFIDNQVDRLTGSIVDLFA